MKEIEIPDSNDIEWQQEMLRDVCALLEKLDESGNVIGNSINDVEQAMKIIDALQRYSGY